MRIARSWHTIVPAVAFVCTLAYGLYLQPQWEPARDDQVDYLQLANGLAARAEFTRALPGEPFVVEAHRRPGYPLAVAALCRTVGCDHWTIAIAQGALYAASAALLLFVARRLLTERAARIASLATALYLPLAYHAALALTETLATFLLLATLACAILARERRSATWAFVAGACAGMLGLTRPVFLPLVALLILFVAWRHPREGLRSVVALALGFALLVAPYTVAAQLSGAPTAASGVVLWGGYFQGHGAELDATEQAEVGGANAEIARSEETIAHGDLAAREAAFVSLDTALGASAARLIAHDPVGWIVRGLTSRTLRLLVEEPPLRVTDAAALPFGVVAGFAALMLLLGLLSIGGIIELVRRRSSTALLVAAVLAYLWLASIPFLTEARYALPARPLLLAAAVAAVPLLTRAGRARTRSR